MKQCVAACIPVCHFLLPFSNHPFAPALVSGFPFVSMCVASLPWWISVRPTGDAGLNTVMPVGALLVLGDALLPAPVLFTAVVVAGLVAVTVMRGGRGGESHGETRGESRGEFEA